MGSFQILTIFVLVHAIFGLRIPSPPAATNIFDGLSTVIVDINEKNEINKRPSVDRNDDLPDDLLQIAATRLGIHRRDEIPTTEEIGQLLGTTNSNETIQLLRNLTSTEDGIALIRAFIDSSDYIDSTSNTSSNTPDPEVIQMPEPKNPDEHKIEFSGFFQRMSSYLDHFNLFSNEEDQQKVENEIEVDNLKTPSMPDSKQVPVRCPFPYHYHVTVYQDPPFVSQKYRIIHLNTFNKPFHPHQKRKKHHDGRKVHTNHQNMIDRLAATVSKLPITSKDAVINSHDVVPNLSISNETFEKK